MTGRTVIVYIYYPAGAGHFALGALMPREKKMIYADSLTSEMKRDEFFLNMRAFLSWAYTKSGHDQLESGRSQTVYNNTLGLHHHDRSF